MPPTSRKGRPPKFAEGQLVRIGGLSGRMPSKIYPHLIEGAVVRIKRVMRSGGLGRGHLGYVIAGEREDQEIILARYELSLEG
jgi:hypothetical protein